MFVAYEPARMSDSGSSSCSKFSVDARHAHGLGNVTVGRIVLENRLAAFGRTRCRL
jgi:hypothetical protein